MLNNLKVVNGSMNPVFRSDIFEYQVEVEKDVLALILDYDAPKDAVITVYGNDYLTDGENHVIIEVYENELFTYTLTVLKEESQTVSEFINSYEKVEVSKENAWLKDLITPGISIVCFMAIITLFCIIFRKK
ncbi:MAG: hypothetical protein E7167_05080 [Firmicutes bacterium]|nr:hypothetical protein [Bacillota bacterium]